MENSPKTESVLSWYNTEELAKLKELDNILTRKVREIIEARDQTRIEEFNDKKYTFYQKLVKKYGEEEVRKRILFHIMSGSSGMTEKDCPYFDFEGEDSIEKFIREL